MFVVFDIETTGLIGSTCDIIEFSYILFDSNNTFVRSEQLYYYYPGMSWNEDAYKVHRIELEELKKHKDSFKENIIKMYSVLNRANVAGHNVKQFDCPFVKQWLTRMGLSNLEFGIVVDTMVAYKPIYKRPRIKLTKLAELMSFSPDTVKTMAGFWFPDANASRPHEASYDVAMTAMLVLKGINEGWISFALNNVSAAEVTTEGMEDVLFTREVKESDPNRFMVKLLDAGEDEQNTYYRIVNHDYEKYVVNTPTDNDIHMFYDNNLLFPYCLKQEEDPARYSVEVGGTTYTYVYDKEDGDTFTISNVFATLRDIDVSMTSTICRLNDSKE